MRTGRIERTPTLDGPSLAAGASTVARAAARALGGRRPRARGTAEETSTRIARDSAQRRHCPSRLAPLGGGATATAGVLAVRSRLATTGSAEAGSAAPGDACRKRGDGRFSPHYRPGPRGDPCGTSWSASRIAVPGGAVAQRSASGCRVALACRRRSRRVGGGDPPLRILEARLRSRLLGDRTLAVSGFNARPGCERRARESGRQRAQHNRHRSPACRRFTLLAITSTGSGASRGGEGEERTSGAEGCAGAWRAKVASDMPRPGVPRCVPPLPCAPACSQARGLDIAYSPPRTRSCARSTHTRWFRARRNASARRRASAPHPCARGAER